MKLKTLIAILTICNVSAYTIFECGGNRITANGEEAKEGITIAADHLPFGTKVKINNHVYTVQDRFGGGYTDRIDIFVVIFHKIWKITTKQLSSEDND